MLFIRSYSLTDTGTIMNGILNDDFDVYFMKIEYHVDNWQYLSISPYTHLYSVGVICNHMQLGAIILST